MTSCTEQIFLAEIKGLKREVEGLTKTREIQEELIQKLRQILRLCKEHMVASGCPDALSTDGPLYWTIDEYLEATDKRGCATKED